MMNEQALALPVLSVVPVVDQLPDHVRVRTRAWVIGLNGAEMMDAKAAIAVALSGTHDLVWIHLDPAAPETAGWLQQLGMSDPVCDALLAGETRPRCDPFPNGAILNLRGPAVAGGEDELVSVRAWLGARLICSTSRREPVALAGVEASWAAGDIRDTGDFVAELAGAIIDRLDPQVAALSDEIDDCEEQMDSELVSQIRPMTHKVRIAAIHFRRFLTPQFQALDRARNLRVDWLSDEDRQHIGEAADRMARMGEEVEAVRERAALLHEQMSDLKAEQIERRSLIVSVVALVALPLTFITGLLGMNVDGIPYSHEPWAFWVVVAACFAMAGGSIVWFVRAHWFN